MDAIKISFYINSLKINQRTLCVYKYTQKYVYQCRLYTRVYICVYIFVYACITVYAHIYLKCVYAYLLKKQTPYSSLKEYSEGIKMTLAEQKSQRKFR